MRLRGTRPFIALLLLALPGASAGAQAPADSTADSVRELWNVIRRNISLAAVQMPETLWAFRPVPEVRSFGELLGHVTDTHYTFCAAALGVPQPSNQDFERAAPKSELVAALERSLAFCDRAYAALTYENGADAVAIFGTRRPRLYPLMFNTAHDNEHYGNMVTYLRLNGMIPPSTPSR